MTGADTSPLAEAVAAWASAWQSCSAARILALWDTSDPHSWYLPADSVDAHIGSAIVGVLQRRCLGLRAATYRPKNIQLRKIGDDVGSAFFELEWARTVDGAPARGGYVRVTMVMRNVTGAWRVFHYAEAPLAPLLELQAFYERVAAEGLDAIPQRMPPV